jgi:hypothetical protein
MQCKDVPDELVLRAVQSTPGYWRTWLAVWPSFEELMPEVPYNVFVAKVRRLNQRGMLHACVHSGKTQCRGDIHLPEECVGC